jgi:hypothetical protein
MNIYLEIHATISVIKCVASHISVYAPINRKLCLKDRNIYLQLLL